MIRSHFASRSFVALATAATLIVAGMPGPPWATAHSARIAAMDPSSDPATVVVVAQPGADLAAVDAAANARGMVRVGAIPAIGVLQYRPARGTGTRAAAATLRSIPGVKAAQRPVMLRAYEAPNDPGYGEQWGLASIRAPEAWVTTTGSGATVAVVDTGVDLTHPDLAGQVLPGYDYVSNDPDPTDENGHGTHVAGIVAAATNNGLGVAGSAPGARILPVRVLDEGGNGMDQTVAAGITWAVDHGAQVINLSLGGPDPSPALESAVQYAASRGVTVVAATGNEAQQSISYPAAYTTVIAVGAIGSSGTRASFSNYGTGIDLVAPGVNVLSTYMANQYAYGSGTSMAAPFVSGAAALLVSAGVAPSNLTSTARDLGTPGYDLEYGNGEVDVAAALGGTVAPTPTPVPGWPTPTPTPTASGSSPTPSPSATPTPSPSPSGEPGPSPSVSPEPSPSEPPDPLDDETPPTVAISGLSTGTTVHGDVEVRATARDASGIFFLSLERNGMLVQSSDEASVAVRWRSQGSNDGLATWTAWATDWAGNESMAAARVLVANRHRLKSIRTHSASIIASATLYKRISVRATTPFVARLSGPSGVRVTLRVLDSRGRVVARASGSGVACIALTALRAGTYTLAWGSSVAGASLRLSADWYA